MTGDSSPGNSADPYAAPAPPAPVSPTVREEAEPESVRPAFTRAHIWVLGILLGMATVATFLITSGGADGGVKEWRQVITTTLLTISGPMTGAICRDMQSCCLEFSASLIPWFLPPLVGAFALQQFWRPKSTGGEFVRVSVWGVAWLAWFFGRFVSFLHALM